MKRTQPVQNWFRLLAKNEAGFLMVACLVLLTTLTLIGTTAYILASTEIKVGAGFRNARSVFQAAQAGVEAGRELLRQINLYRTTDSFKRGAHFLCVVAPPHPDAERVCRANGFGYIVFPPR